MLETNQSLTVLIFENAELLPSAMSEKVGLTKDLGRCLCPVKVREVRVICITFYILPLQELCERELLINIS